jgi:uncharacterized membrane protein (UPF0127 family)
MPRDKKFDVPPFLAGGPWNAFYFSSGRHVGFWMKNTNVPLDIIWMDSSGRIVGIAHNVQPSHFDQPPVLKNDRPAKYVLEANAGFADGNKIAVGDTARIR